MKSKFKIFIAKPFIRNVVIMASGTAAAQLINLVLQPIITRLYGPEAYGLMGVFMAIVAIVSPIAALTYPIAIVLPKSDTVAKGLVRLSLYITAGAAMIAGAVLIFFNELIINVFQLENIASFLYLIPLVILFSGILQVTEQWLIRTSQFSITARVTFFQALILNGSKVGIGFFHPVASVLIVLSSFGSALKASMMIFLSRKSSNDRSLEVVDTRISIKELGIRHRDFPLFRAPEVFLNAVSQSLPILMLTSFFGPASAGFYAIGRTVLSIPANLIGKSVGDVFYPRISKAANNGENLTSLIKKATFALASVGLLPYLTIVVFGPWLFSFVFGNEWSMAGEYARWIAIWTFFMFINQPSVRALPALSAQAFHLKFTVFTLLIRIAALAVGFYIFSSDLVAIALFGVSGAVINIFLILITLQISRKFDKEKAEQ